MDFSSFSMKNSNWIGFSFEGKIERKENKNTQKNTRQITKLKSFLPLASILIKFIIHTHTNRDGVIVPIDGKKVNKYPNKLPGNSKKFDVRRWRPRADDWNASGPTSSFENSDEFDAALLIESREFRRLAKNARPP